jgi:hypothetical protein
MEDSVMATKRHSQDWEEAKKRCRLNEADIQMAKELGMTPKSLIKNIPAPNQQWKVPVKVWIRDLYEEKFNRVLTVKPIHSSDIKRTTKKLEKPIVSDEQIKVILRAADEIIAKGGRTLLAKILKGSREKKVLQLELDRCPVYGYFKSETLDEIIQKIDWMIDHDFLDIEYNGKLPMIIFTERGWHIESDQYQFNILMSY